MKEKCLIVSMALMATLAMPSMVCAESLPKLRLIEPPLGMPGAVMMDNGQWLLPAPTAEWMRLVLAHYKELPAHIEYREAENDRQWRIVLRATVDAARADERAMLESGKIEIWHLMVAGGGALVFGAAAGIVIGAIAR